MDKISELERLTLALHHDEDAHSLNLALANAAEGIARMDFDDRFVWVNAAYCAISGYLPNELTGKKWDEVSGLALPEDIDKVRRASLEMINLGRVTLEIQGCKPGGETYWKRLTLVPAIDRMARLVGKFHLVQDISHRRRNEANLKALNDIVATREHQLSAMFNAAQDAMVTAGVDAVITSWNTAAERIFGWTAKEVVGTSAVDTIVPEEMRSGFQERYAAILAESAAPLYRVYAVTARRRTGDYFPAELTLAMWNDAGGKRFCTAFIRDVTLRGVCSGGPPPGCPMLCRNASAPVAVSISPASPTPPGN